MEWGGRSAGTVSVAARSAWLATWPPNSRPGPSSGVAPTNTSLPSGCRSRRSRTNAVPSVTADERGRQTPPASNCADRSVGALAQQDRGDRLADDGEVTEQGPVLDVIEVEAGVVGERGVAAAAHLPHAGDPRPREQAVEQVGRPAAHLRRQCRPRADDAH